MQSNIRLIEDILKMDSVDAWEEGKSTVAHVLPEKRMDDHYAAVILSLKRYGFTKNIRLSPCETEVRDGHHRLAAALDLGWKYVPIEHASWCDDDSGDWTGADLAETIIAEGTL